MFGAYVADAYWGRFKTICVAVVIALLGHAILVVSALPDVIEHPHLSLIYFIFAIVIMGVGTGGFKANISPLVAEQYRETKLFTRTTTNGEKVIVDPALTTARIYMVRRLLSLAYAYSSQYAVFLFIYKRWCLSRPGLHDIRREGEYIHMLPSRTLFICSPQYVGFWLAYLLPTVIFLLCPVVLYLGRNRYVKSPPSGSVFGLVLRTWSYLMQGRWSLNPYTTFRNMTALDMWDGAKPSNLPSPHRPAWMTFDEQGVDELKRGLKACEVFLWYPVFCKSLFPYLSQQQS